MNVRAVPEFADVIPKRIFGVGLRRACLAILGIAAIVQSVAGQPATERLPVKNDLLRRELLAMRSEDQAARIESLRTLKRLGVDVGDPNSHKDPRVKEILAEESAKTTAIDTKNRKRLAEIIDEHGWPGKTLVGPDGANAAWLIAQHADADVDFQKWCLQLMKAAPPGEVELSSVAYLTDRVLVNEQKPQRYGTQMRENFEPQPIEDPKNVDQRRAEVGLPPLHEYLKTAREFYEKTARSAQQRETTDKFAPH